MDPFIWRVILSFIVGGSYAATLMWISEKYGTKVGGILTGIPTTVFIGLVFIALTSSKQTAHDAAAIIPAMTGVSLILVYCFTRLMILRTPVALAAAVATWLLVAISLVRLHIQNIWLSVSIGIALFALTYRGMHKYPHNLKAAGQTFRRTYAARIIAAGSVIACAVVMARAAGPVWGGVFAAFPATFVTTLYMLRQAQGTNFAQAVARQLPLANGSTLLFAVIFYLLVLHTSIALTALLAATGSLCYAFALVKFSATR